MKQDDADTSEDELDLTPAKKPLKRAKGNPDVERLKAQVVKRLGGDSFLTSRILNRSFNPSLGTTFWRLLNKAVQLSFDFAPSSNSREKGEFPQILIQALSKAINQRAGTAPVEDGNILRLDVEAAAKFLERKSLIRGEITITFIRRR